MSDTELKKTQFLWSHHLANLYIARIDFGPIAEEGKHFFIDVEFNYPAPAPGSDLEAWKKKISDWMTGDISSLLSYPPGVILGNYMLRFYEQEEQKHAGWTTVVLDDLFFTKNGIQIYAEWKKQQTPLKWPGYPEPLRHE